MKKDMVKTLFELYEKFDPKFHEIFALEYPKLTDEEQLQFLKMLSVDMDNVVDMLRNIKKETLPVAA